MTSARISALGSVSFGWLHQEGGFEFGESFFLDPRVRTEQERAMRKFVSSRFPADPIYSIEAHLVQVEGRRQPVVLVGGIQPNLILGAALGAQLVFYHDKDPDISPTPLADIASPDVLAAVDWGHTWPVNMLLEQVQAIREELEPPGIVVPPFFWDATGRATTHGIVTTAQKLIGERVFLEMADHSTFVSELFEAIADSYAELIRRFAEAAKMPVRELHTGDCSLCMVGPDLFERLVLPSVNRLSRQVGPVRLHSCGLSDHLLEVFEQVQGLVSLNVGSHTSIARIRQRFGDMPIDVIPDTQLLTTGTPAQIDSWVRQSIDENGDGELQFQYHLDVGQEEAPCLQIHRTLQSLGFGDSREEIY